MVPPFLLVSLALATALPAAVILAVLLLLGSRSEPDPQRRRPYAVYLFTVMFVALIVAVLAGSQTAGALARVVLEPEPRHPADLLDPFDPSGPPGAWPLTTIEPGDSEASSGVPAQPVQLHTPITTGDPGEVADRAARDGIRSVFLGLPAVWVLWFHRRRVPALLAEAGTSTTVVQRLHEIFLHTVCFAGVVTAMFAVPLAVWGAIRWGWPALTAPPGAPDEASHGLVQLAADGALALGAIAAARVHWLDAGHGGDDASDLDDPAPATDPTGTEG
jgi:hypothetical protein